MKNHQLQNVPILVLILLTFISWPARASITGTSAINSPTQLSANSQGSSQVTWTVTENTGVNGGLVTLSSASGVFRAPNSAVLGTTGQVQKTVNIASNSGPVPVTISETLTIPLSVIQQAQQLGFSSFIYERTFSDGATGPTASVTFTILTTQISQPSVTNFPASTAITSTGHSQLSWTMNATGAPNTQVTISSTSGLFLAPDGSQLAIVSQPLQTTQILINGSATFRFNESLTIPQSVARLAQQKGFGRFDYRRQFSDGQTSVTATATFTITGSSASGVLSIRRIQMEYDDGRVTAVITPDSEIRAHAILSYTGTGLLEYSWEVASPASTQGEPVFVPLISRKQYLLAGDRVVLRSPRLPTNQQGEYLLRLRLHKPTAEFALPQLRYAVNNSGRAQVLTQIQPLQVSRPAAGTILGQETRFAWQPVPAASAYQLEIYNRQVRDQALPSDTQHPPVTGVLVPATTTQLMVGSLARTHLLAGATYYWRVIAFSNKGDVIARSDFRRIKLP